MRRVGFVAIVAIATLGLAACGADEKPAPKAQKTYYAPASMEPTLKKGEGFTVSAPPPVLETGMIVLFTDPGGWLGSSSKGGKLIKRIVGVEGDRVKCCDAGGHITINGKVLDESSYLRPGTPASEDPFDVTVPVGHLWVLGDNRSFSADSRFHLGDPGGGFVDKDLVVGIYKS